MEYRCPECGEEKNLHYNYDWNKQSRPVIDVLCNECGEFFDEKQDLVSSKDDTRSKHWADVLNWLKKVVRDCNTVEQADSCLRLLANFERIYENKIGFSNCMEYLRPLKNKLWDVGNLTFSEKMKKIQL